MIKIKHCAGIVLLFLSVPCLGSEPVRVDRLATFAQGRVAPEAISNLKKQAAQENMEEVLVSNKQPQLFVRFPTLRSKIDRNAAAKVRPIFSFT